MIDPEPWPARLLPFVASPCTALSPVAAHVTGFGSAHKIEEPIGIASVNRTDLLSLHQRAVGSPPTRPTKFLNDFRIFLLACVSLAPTHATEPAQYTWAGSLIGNHAIDRAKTRRVQVAIRSLDEVH